MSKLPWEKHLDIDFDADFKSIAEQYQSRYFESAEDLVEWYFKAKMYKMASIAFGITSAILLYVLITVAK